MKAKVKPEVKKSKKGKVDQKVKEKASPKKKFTKTLIIARKGGTKVRLGYDPKTKEWEEISVLTKKKKVKEKKK